MYGLATYKLKVCWCWGKAVNASFRYFQPSTRTMHSNHCKNCGHLLSETYQFCPDCGQTAHVHKFSFGHLAHELFHAFTHADKGILLLLKGLAINPGKVVSEYVDGKRKKYFSPFTFFLLCVGFFVFMSTWVKPNGEDPTVDPAVLARIPTEAGKKMYITAMERSKTVYTVTQKHPNILAMIALPFNAFFFWIFFGRRGRNYIEFIVAMLFLGSFANLVFSVAIYPIMSATRVPYPTVYWCTLVGGLFLQAVFVSWGIKGLVSTKRQVIYWKILPVGVLHNIVWGLGTAYLFIWYVARERTGKILGAIWENLVH